MWEKFFFLLNNIEYFSFFILEQQLVKLLCEVKPLEAITDNKFCFK